LQKPLGEVDLLLPYEHFPHTHCGKYLDQNQEADFHLELAQSEVELRDQGDRESVAGGEQLVASTLVVDVASTSGAAFFIFFSVWFERKSPLVFFSLFFLFYGV
jgi:hypothetical protein